MELASALTIIIYFLLIVLITILIVIGIKLIITIDKVNQIVDDVKTKLSALDKIFTVVDLVNNKLSIVTDAIVGFIAGTIKKITNKKSKIKKED